MRRAVIVIAALATLPLAACTSSGSRAPSTPPDSTVYRTVTQTNSASQPSPQQGAPTPVGTAPTKAATATSCPLLTTATAVATGGMRLGRITVLTADRKSVGCRFYGQQEPNGQCDASCLAKEKLPPADQPAIEVTTTRYRTALDAHNAIVLIARKGTQPQQVDVGKGNIGVCYETAFYAKDKGKDWACTFSVAKVAVVVRTVATLSSIARDVTRQVARRV